MNKSESTTKTISSLPKFIVLSLFCFLILVGIFGSDNINSWILTPQKLLFDIFGSALYKGQQQAKDNNPEGHEQLKDAFDAALIRIIQSNDFFDYIDEAELTDLNLLITDCYWEESDPLDVVYPYPTQPKGILRNIIERGEIKFGNLQPEGPYIPFLKKLLNKIVDLLEAEYSTSITRTEVFPTGFGSAYNFANLVSGDIDVLIPIAAIGGTYQDPNNNNNDSKHLVVRRSKAFYRSCSVAANSFHIWSKHPSITKLQDARNLGAALTVCYNGPNAGLTRSNFPKATLQRYFANAPVKCQSLVESDPTGNTIAFMEFETIPTPNAQLNVIKANQASPTAFWFLNPYYWQ